MILVLLLGMVIGTGRADNPGTHVTVIRGRWGSVCLLLVSTCVIVHWTSVRMVPGCCFVLVRWLHHQVTVGSGRSCRRSRVISSSGWVLGLIVLLLLLLVIRLLVVVQLLVVRTWPRAVLTHRGRGRGLIVARVRGRNCVCGIIAGHRWRRLALDVVVGIVVRLLAIRRRIVDDGRGVITAAIRGRRGLPTGLLIVTRRGILVMIMHVHLQGGAAVEEQATLATGKAAG